MNSISAFGSSKKLISIVIPMYNEESNVKELYQRIIMAINSLSLTFEILFVDNGSSDKTLSLLKELHSQDNRCCYLSLSRNFGHQGALLAGIHFAKGKAVITMDGDLQHPPELLPDMIKCWEEGYHVVHTIKKSNFKSWNLRKGIDKYYYRMLSYLAGLNIEYGQTDFRLLDRKIVDIICAMPERNKFIRGLVSWSGFKQTKLEYSPKPRFSGESKFSYLNLIRFATNGFLSFSSLPLHIISTVGFIASALSGVILIIHFGLFIFNPLLGWNILPPGWATLLVSVLFIGSVQLFCIGLLGEYISLIFDETKHRPQFIVMEHSDSSNN